ncbi:MAG: hypothetical protein RI575_17525 [Balneolaceae bacterium]|nr:hypothetical protein [Balneolaceae bacterium]
MNQLFPPGLVFAPAQSVTSLLQQIPEGWIHYTIQCSFQRDSSLHLLFSRLALNDRRDGNSSTAYNTSCLIHTSHYAVLTSSCRSGVRKTGILLMNQKRRGSYTCTCHPERSVGSPTNNKQQPETL